MSNVTTPRSAQNESDKMKQGVQDTANAAAQKAQDLAHKAGEKAQDLAHAAGQKVQDAAHAAGQKAEDATASLGSGMKTAAEKVRENAPHEGMLGRGAEAVASTLDRGGDYLREKNLHGMAEDMTEMIKRNPIPAVLLGIGLGFLLGRTLRS
jgi:dsDNA-specific endonuclease/ATPase MutS2